MKRLVVALMLAAWLFTGCRNPLPQNTHVESTTPVPLANESSPNEHSGTDFAKPTSAQELEALWQEYGLDPTQQPWRDHEHVEDHLEIVKTGIEESRATALPEPDAYDFSHAVLWDVQGLFGGWRVFLKDEGNVIVQLIKAEGPLDGVLPEGCHFWNYEHHFKLEAEVLQQLKNTLERVKFFSMVLAARIGTPDEAHPSITIRLRDGRTREVSSWIGDRHLGFVAVYDVLEALVNRAESANPVTPKPYRYDDPLPEGFKWLRD